MEQEHPIGPGDLEVLRGLCHAFASTPELGQAMELSLRWVAISLMPSESASVIARPDPRGRLRVVAGKSSALGRRRSARRRAAFQDKKPHLLQLPVDEEGLLFLPLVTRGTCVGVLEIQAPAQLLSERVSVLESIASQTA